MKILFFFSLTLFVFAAPLTAYSDTRVALLVSGYGNEGDPDISYDLEELAQAYLVLTNNGIELDIVSPKGGKVPVHDKKDDLAYIQYFKQKTDALAQLDDTVSAKDALGRDYQGLMIIGGDGAMFDLPVDEHTQMLVTQFARRNQPIAAVCHGPAALVNIKLDNGEYFIKGKRVNSFTMREEQAFSTELLDEFPFMLQATIEERGASFVSNGPMLPFLAEDDRLITAQNPMSVAKAAEALVVKLGLSLQQRKMFKDEATFQLVSRARAEGPFIIDIELSKSKPNYDMNHLALYGFYAYRLAETPEEKQVELEIMARIGQHFSHPKYSLALINAFLEQGFEKRARTEKTRLLKRFPDVELPSALASL